MKYHFVPPGMAVMKENKKSASVGKDIDMLEPSYVAGGIVNWCRCCEKPFGSSSKMSPKLTQKHRSYPMTQQFCFPTSTPKGIEDRLTEKLVHKYL